MISRSGLHSGNLAAGHLEICLPSRRCVARGEGPIAGSGKGNQFFRLHRSCRPAALARIRYVAGAANTAGWPVKTPDCRWQADEKPNPRLRRPTRRSFALRRDLNRPSQPRLFDLAGELRECGHRILGGAGRTSGRDLTVEVEHVLETPPHGQGNAATPLLLRWRRPSRISTGQPASFAATAPYGIRASAAGRQEDRNDRNWIPVPEQRAHAIPRRKKG